MTLTLTSAWTAASWFEAERVRATEVDLDHLYLGLISIGGAAARLLGEHGISLESARRRARETMTDDLASLGVDTSGVTLPTPLSMQQVVANDPQYRSTARAKEVLDKSTKALNTFDLLAALLREPTKTVRRLVYADGVEPQELIPGLKEGADDQYAPQKIAPISGLLPDPARAYRVHHYLSAPAEVVAEVLASPDFLSLWGYDPARSTVVSSSEDVIRALTTKGSKSMTIDHEVTRGSRDEALSVDWTRRLVDTRWAGEALGYDHFEVRPAPGGAELVRDNGRRAFGLLGRVIAPATDKMQFWPMLHFRYLLAFAVADRQAGLR